MFAGVKQFLLPLPFPIFDLVHVQFICFYDTDEQLFIRTAFTRKLDYRWREQLLPEQLVNW